MNRFRANPHLFEANAQLWLSRMATTNATSLSLSTVPQAELECIARYFDFLWLMGVWQRSPAARDCALAFPGAADRYEAALPGWSASDVDGSPYAIAGYRVGGSLGDDGDLRLLRDRLNALGCGLIVDFTGNDLARDHPWTLDHPEWFVRADEPTARKRPGEFFRTENGDWLAHGRDPNFPSWTDTAQINLACQDARDALCELLMDIAGKTDGVRCDMAMLGLNEIFSRTWEQQADTATQGMTEFWAEIIERVKRKYPDFVFVAEVYWGLEDRLLRLGFDFVYDKTFYDLLLAGDGAAITRHLASIPLLLRRGLRFAENHDQARAVVAFGRRRALLAAVAVMTLPGLRMIQDGQAEGRRITLPVQLVREPAEPIDQETRDFYMRLLEIANLPDFHDGEWQLLNAEPASLSDRSYSNVLVWAWVFEDRVHLVALNQSEQEAHAMVKMPPGHAGPSENWLSLLNSKLTPPATTDSGAIELVLAGWSADIWCNAGVNRTELPGSAFA